MLTLVEFTPIEGSGPGLPIPVTDSDPDAPLVVRDVQGLGPADATIDAQSLSAQDGEFFVGSHIGKRNIVLTLGLNKITEGWNLIYGWMMPKSLVALRLTTNDRPIVTIHGYVETIAANKFSQDPEAVISIICPKSDFIGTEIFTEIGDAEETAPTPTDIQYDGLVNAPLRFTIRSGTGYFGDLFIEHTNTTVGTPVWRGMLLNDIVLPAGYEVLLDTTPGNKTIEMYPVIPDVDFPPVANNLLWAMDDQSIWPTLWPGANQIRVRTPGDAGIRGWSLDYSERFGGI